MIEVSKVLYKNDGHRHSIFNIVDEIKEVLAKADALTLACLTASPAPEGWPSEEGLTEVVARARVDYESLNAAARFALPRDQFIARAVLSCLPRQSEGWQPIETAPENEPVLACNPARGALPIVAKRKGGIWQACCARPKIYLSGDDRPSHWRQLDAPPNDANHSLTTKTGQP